MQVAVVERERVAERRERRERRAADAHREQLSFRSPL